MDVVIAGSPSEVVVLAAVVAARSERGSAIAPKLASFVARAAANEANFGFVGVDRAAGRGSWN